MKLKVRNAAGIRQQLVLCARLGGGSCGESYRLQRVGKTRKTDNKESHERNYVQRSWDSDSECDNFVAESRQMISGVEPRSCGMVGFGQIKLMFTNVIAIGG